MRTLRSLALVTAISTVAGAVACKPKSTSQDDTEDAGTDDAGTDDAGADNTPKKPVTISLDLYGDPLPAGAVARLGSVRMLDREIQNMVFTPDGKGIISNSNSGYTLWDAETTKRVGALELTDASWPIAVTPSGGGMATGTLGGRIQLWNLKTRKAKNSFEAHKKEVTGLCYTAESTLVSVSEDMTLKLWETTPEEPEEKRTVSGEWGPITSLTCGANGLIVWGTEDGGLYWLDQGAKSWRQELGRAQKRVTDIAVSRDGSLVAAVSDDANLYLWRRSEDGQAGEPRVIGAHDRSARSVSFAPDGKVVMTSGGDRYFRSWDVASGRLIRDTVGIVGLSAQYLELSPDGSRYASWSEYHVARGSEAGRWWMWKVSDGKPIEEPERHLGEVHALAVSSDGQLAATASADGTVRLWSVTSGKALGVSGSAARGAQRAVLFGDGDTAIWSSGSDAAINVWDRSDNRVRQPFDPVGGEVTAFDIGPGGSPVVTGDFTGKVWKYDGRGRKLGRIDGEMFEAINDVALHPRKSIAVIAGSDNVLLVVNTDSGEELARLKAPTVSNLAIDISEDGRFLASATSDHVIHIWDAEKWEMVRTLEGHDGTVRSVAFSTDGALLVSGGNDETVRVWRVDSGELKQTFEGHRAEVTDVAFADGSGVVISVSGDRTGLVWRLPGSETAKDEAPGTPGKTPEPDDVKADAGKTDAGKTDAGKTDDAKADDAKADDGKTDDGKTDDGKTDDGKTDDG